MTRGVGVAAAIIVVFLGPMPLAAAESPACNPTAVGCAWTEDFGEPTVRHYDGIESTSGTRAGRASFAGLAAGVPLFYPLDYLGLPSRAGVRWSGLSAAVPAGVASLQLRIRATAEWSAAGEGSFVLIGGLSSAGCAAGDHVDISGEGAETTMLVALPCVPSDGTVEVAVEAYTDFTSGLYRADITIEDVELSW